MKLKPLQDWAVIQRIEPKEMTAAGIIIPEAAKEKPTEGIVLAIGPGKFVEEKDKEKKKDKEKEKKFVATVLRPGQRIIYGKYSAREFELDGETIILVREEDVLGTVEESQLIEKQSFAVAKKPATPLAVKKEGQVMTVAVPPVQKKKPAEKKTEKKKKPAPKAVEKKESKKVGTGTIRKKNPVKPLKKVRPQKTSGKKTVIKKVTPKTIKKTTPVKKMKATEGKVAVKKTTGQKTVVKKPAVKKIVQKKTDVQKKKVAPKKAVAKPSKNTVGTKAVTAKKKQTVKKATVKGKARAKK